MNEAQPSLLKDPISISDLIGTGTKFQLNNECFNEQSENFDDDDVGLEEDDVGVELDLNKIKSPWQKPFEELRQQMIQIDEDIYKRIVKHGNMEKGAMPEKSRVHIRYNSYWEGEGGPFDSSSLRGTIFSFYTGRSSVLEGLEKAVRTMYEGEEAQFVISYKLLFGGMGCPPRIKKRADGLFVIELVSFNAVGDIDALKDVIEEDRKKFIKVVKQVKEIHLKGLDFFKLKNNKNAAHAFEKAIDALTYCHSENEDEEKERTEFLIKLHTNLALLYNKLERPRDACMMCNEIRRLSKNEPPCKALFQEGRALLKLGEFAKAKSVLVRAQHMEPHNHSINEELDKLEKCSKKYQENETSIWQKALGFKKPQEVNTNSAEESQLTDFEETMLEILHDFKKNSDDKFNIPSNLTREELDAVDKLAQSLNMYLRFSEIEKSYSIHKN